MTPTTSATGRQRLFFVPAPAKSVPPTAPRPPDPPIYREMMRAWADRGRTLPGHHDPEWVRLAAPQVRPGQFSGVRGHAAAGDGRQDPVGAPDDAEHRGARPCSSPEPATEGSRAAATL
ncbi:hypothetical protein [Streptomyces sp. MUM 136J]|uniref:hypothetical protein n=1 Tax=Streptomyces sp. MUM 136J TaxID=2791992 RepID=UPI001F04D224|nr:hypothetical protein [Streptomyces sp. MUM 136J]